MNVAAANVKHIVQVSTNITTGCKDGSGHRIGGEDRFAESVNHYIEQHGYTLLHVGQQSSDDSEGRLWHAAVAVLGRE